MAQVAHVDVGDTPVDLTDGLAAGCYVAQVGAALAVIGDAALLYATAETAPSDDDDYYRAGFREFFSFTVADDVPPTWAKAPAAMAVALALVPA